MIQNSSHKILSRCLIIILSIWLFLLCSCYSSKDTHLLLERPGNALISYYEAIIKLKFPVSEEEIRLIKFIDDQLNKYPPGIFEDYTGVSSILSEEETLIPFLHNGAQKPYCRFDYDYSNGLFQIGGPPIIPFKKLCNHSLGIAKLFQHHRTMKKAASLYVDLLQFGTHINEEPLLINLLFGNSFLESTLDDIDGFLAHRPGKEALEILLSGLKRITRQSVDIARIYRVETELYAEWILQNIDKDVSLAEEFLRFEVLLSRSDFEKEEEISSEIEKSLQDENIKRTIAIIKSRLSDHINYMNLILETFELPFMEQLSLMMERIREAEEKLERFTLNDNHYMVKQNFKSILLTMHLNKQIRTRMFMVQILCAAILENIQETLKS